MGGKTCGGKVEDKSEVFADRLLEEGSSPQRL